MKLYRTRTQEEYDWLARELNKKGMVSYIPRHEQGGDIVIYADEKEDYLSYSDLDYAEEEHPNEPIIEVSDLMGTVDHDTLMQRNNKPETQEPYTPPNTGDPWIDNLPESYFEMYEEEDAIRPQHYRKGEIDLYESWYRTYPFNEFRAGMQMIAERYMKRDKEDRVQDLDKAMETLKRLKEYEEMEEEE